MSPHGGSRAVRWVVGLAVVLPLAGSQLAADDAPPSWRQWGGPTQDFVAPALGLAASWPAEGPRRLWQHELGEGQSAVLYEDGRLYTMHRPGGAAGGSEAVICLDAASGDPVWEYRYEAAYAGLPGYGVGPRATPLLAGERLFTVGIGGIMLALDKRNGDVLWRHELWGSEFGGNVLGHGYASSPVAWRDLVIVPVGGEGAGLVAFDQQSGVVVWRGLDFRNSYSSPQIVEILGEEQLVVFMAEEVIGVAPETGELRWRYPQVNQWGHNITLPKVVDGDTVFISSPQAGARGLKLTANGESIDVEQVWATRSIQFYHASTVRGGDWVYGSSGTVAVTVMAAINLRTGEIAWRQRGFSRANCVAVDGRTLMLDDDGVLYLTSMTPDGIEVHSQTKLLDRTAWTVPTVVGQTLYVRDEKRILAVDLS